MSGFIVSVYGAESKPQNLLLPDMRKRLNAAFRQFSRHTPKLRYAAKVTQRKYGICSAAAFALTA